MDRHLLSLHAPSASRILELPTELLELIFLEVCSEQKLYLPPVYYQRSRRNSCPALDISWVCARWRAVALASTALWTPPRLIVQLRRYEKLMSQTSPDVVKRKCNGLLQCYIQRSGSRPVNVLITDDLRCADDWEQSVGDIVNIVCSTVPRWRVCVVPNYVACRLFSAAQTTKPLLEVARVTDNGESDSDVDLDLSHASRLCYWHGPLATIAGGKLILPWHQLTRLDSDKSISIGTFMQIIPLCQALVQLRVRISRNDTPGPLPLQKEVTLPRLLIVTFVFEDYDTLAHTFSTLTTPELLFLRVFGGVREQANEPSRPQYSKTPVSLPRWPFVEFTGWLRRSGNKLRALKLCNFTLPRRSVVDLMELLPQLTSLDLYAETFRDSPSERTPAVDDDTLLRLTARDGALPDLLPNLSRLFISGAGASDKALSISMIESRRDPPLKNVVIWVGNWTCISKEPDTELLVNGRPVREADVEESDSEEADVEEADE